MAKAQPGFEGIFSILSQIPEERLVALKHKLNHARLGTSSSKLLQGMVLLTLGRETEARICLEALGDDEGALCLCRSKWGTASRKNPLSPQQEAGVQLALARVYALLVEENQCSPRCRDDAYKAAVKAFRASKTPGRDRLGSVLAEASAKCGLNFTSAETDNEFKTLMSDPEHFPTPSLALEGRAPPVQIRSPSVLSGPQTLRSSGSPASFISHFEISQSPTVEFRTRSAHRSSLPLPSRLRGGAAASGIAMSGQERLSHGPRGASQLSCSTAPPLQSHRAEAPHAGGFVPLFLPVPETPIHTLHGPVECTDPPTMVTAGLQESRLPLPQAPEQEPPLEPPCLRPSEPATITSRVLIQDSYVVTDRANSDSFSSSKEPLPPQAAAAPTPELDCGEKRFFSFVVVHAMEDVAIACRVREMLEGMGVPDGATFCEEFLIPGQCPLTCFQDAIDNSAFTLLLLTQNFESRLCMHQMSTALLNSLQRRPKYNSVIPFVPKEYPLKKPQMPGMLVGLVPLDENSPVFSRTVKNTFRLKKIEEQKTMWCQLQHVQEQQRKQQLYQEHLQQLQTSLAGLTLASQPGYPPQMLLPSPAGIQQLLQQLLSGFQLQTPSLPMFSSPSLHQPPPANPFAHPLLAPSPSQDFILPSGHQNMMQGSGGPQPLIIQNAQMVQIGDYSQMHVEKTMSALESSDEEAGESV